MSTSLRHMLGHSFIFIVFDGINKAIPFLLLPYLTRRLAIAEFGLLELFNTYVALLVLLIMFGVDGWCSAHFHKLERNVFSGMLRLGLRSIAAVFAVSMFAMLFVADDPRFIFAPLYALGMCLIQIRAILYRFELKTIKASILLFLNVSVSSLLTIGAFELMTPGFTWRLVALLLPVVCLGCFSCYSVCRQFPASSASNVGVRTLWKFTLPLLPNGLINFVRFGADRFFVAKVFGVSQLALFGVGYQFAMVANIFMLSLNQAVMPFMMKYLSNRNYSTYIKVSSMLILLFLIFISMLYIITPYILQLFFSGAYVSAEIISSRYYLAYPMIFISILAMNLAFFNGNTKFVLCITSVSSAVHLMVLYIISNNMFSIYQVPLALVISSVVSFLLSAIYFYVKVKDEK
ncbi:oligosaccharide flippase family protein [Vibrio metschnikovii]|uniref:Oligosaccharide flippase family protein n=1 Tax=bacterium 19PA01SH03 TaxID=2920705 RepID=A0AAU6SND9_UNCXX|nr:oligosaccharide flippase family protein [Vibrio metschnikovii]EKO3663873.1 oligosaccharide flippase family protein [Vibrio metschnikovii]EKO3733341.1 oligosaccharide flippase family protein [Vibrio metschnikovii]EKO3753699.1 oligosaccharide flippase family protein [Vibrio metschnikovii]EKO3902326.1 oligosaccharide flippase family protein [Vibrio metschnikovii]